MATNCLDDIPMLFSEAIEVESKSICTFVIKAEKMTNRDDQVIPPFKTEKNDLRCLSKHLAYFQPSKVNLTGWEVDTWYTQ